MHTPTTPGYGRQLYTPLTCQEIWFFASLLSNPCSVLDMRNYLVKKTPLALINIVKITDFRNDWMVNPIDEHGSAIHDLSMAG